MVVRIARHEATHSIIGPANNPRRVDPMSFASQRRTAHLDHTASSQARERRHFLRSHTGHCRSRPGIQWTMGEHTEQRITERSRVARKRPGEQTGEAIGRRLLEIVVYDKHCRIGGTLTLDDLSETVIGDWKMSRFRMACTYAVSQGWLIVSNDALTLTAAGLGAG